MEILKTKMTKQNKQKLTTRLKGFINISIVFEGIMIILTTLESLD